MTRRRAIIIGASGYLRLLKTGIVLACFFPFAGCGGAGNEQFWRDDLNAAFRESKQDGLPILLVFSAYGLGDHEFLDELAFSKKTHRMLRKNFEVAVLMVDDERTMGLQSEKDCLSQIFNKFQSTSDFESLGALYRQFEIDVFQRDFQPLYVIIDSLGQVLQGPMGHQNRDVDSFFDFLQKGLEKHNSSHKVAPEPN